MLKSVLSFSFDKEADGYHQGRTTYLERHILAAEPTSGSDPKGQWMNGWLGSSAMPVLYHCLVPCPSLGCMGDSRELKPSEGMVLRVCPSPILFLSNHWQTEPQAGMLVQGLWMSAGFINAFCGSKMVNTLAAAFHPTAWEKKKGGIQLLPVFCQCTVCCVGNFWSGQ